MADKKVRKKDTLSPLFWATIKSLWESGRFATAQEFHKYGVETFKKFPSLSLLQKKMAEERWDRNRTVKEIEERAQTSYSDLFSEEGMGDREVVKRICEGIRAPERTIKSIVAYASANGGTIDDETLKKFADAMNYDLRTAQGFIEERSKMVGAYAASKHKLSGKVSLTDLRSMSLEEAAAEHERIHRNFVAAGLCKKP